MKIDLRSCSIAELAAYVGATLQAAGFRAVLTGGSAVSIYTENLHQTNDLDFIVSASNEEIAGVLKIIGFVNNEGRHFGHPECPYVLEFPSPPLMIGNRLIRETAVQKNQFGEFNVLTATQSVQDRLAAYFLGMIRSHCTTLSKLRNDTGWIGQNYRIGQRKKASHLNLRCSSGKSNSRIDPNSGI